MSYQPKPDCILGTVLADRLGLDWWLDASERSDVGITLAQCRRYYGSLKALWHNSSLRTTRKQRWYKSFVGVVGRP